MTNINSTMSKEANANIASQLHTAHSSRHTMPIAVDASANSTCEKGTRCYICLGEDNEDEQPLRRDCSCRGSDAGFVHLACLVEHAASRSKKWNGRDLVEFSKPWEVCLCCFRFYQNKLAMDISSEFVAFVEKEFPGDVCKQIESLDMKLGVLVTMIGSLRPEEKFETSNVAHKILSLINQLRVAKPNLPASYLMREAHAYKSLGQISLQERTGTGARLAVTHFEKQLELEHKIGDAEGAADAKFSIALARSKYEGSNDSNNELLLKVSQDVYKLYSAELGAEDAATINAGGNYAISLNNAKRGIEAEVLLKNLVAVSRRVHGPHHRITKSVELSLQWVHHSNAKLDAIKIRSQLKTTLVGR